MTKIYDYLVVGAGFFGSVIAERIANDLGRSVLIIDKRNHIAGNCYSEIDELTGIETHKYGTHIFHTSSQEVWNYITRFTKFNNYHHQVLATYKDKVYQLPINLETINSFYNLNLKPTEAKLFIQNEINKERIISPKNLEEKAISIVGRPLYEAFIKGYTTKQWDKHPKDLPSHIITRLPVRYNYNEDYFNGCRWQGIPLNGYTQVIKNMINSPLIDITLNCDYFKFRNNIKVREKTIYTGPIDRYFSFKFGRLEWRSIELIKSHPEVGDFQGTSVMNYADSETPYTRIHEPKHLHPERKYTHANTVIFHETSKNDINKPFYPIPSKSNKSLYEKYNTLVENEPNLIIGGRLGQYAYFDMDQTILSALSCYKNKIVKK